MECRDAEVKSLRQQLTAAASQHQKEVKDLKRTIKQLELIQSEAAAGQQQQAGLSGSAVQQVSALQVVTDT